MSGCTSILYHIFSSKLLPLMLQYWLAPRSLWLLVCYFEYAFTSTITSRWFLSFRKVLIESFSSSMTFPTTTMGTSISKIARTTTTSGEAVGTIEFTHYRRPNHVRTISATQDPTKTHPFIQNRDDWEQRI
jgi:hypothetical protein